MTSNVVNGNVNGVALSPITFALLGFLLAAVSSLVAGGIAWVDFDNLTFEAPV